MTGLDTQTDDAHGPPAGFCPRCEYRMNPGTCPECGETSTVAQLHRVPRSQQRRRKIRRTVILIVLLSLGLGGAHFYRSGIWFRWLPTSALFWMDPASRAANDELIARSSRGLLSPEDSAQLVRRMLAIKTYIRSPRPIGSTFLLDLKVSTQNGLSGYSINSSAPSICLDGAALNNDRVMTRQSSTGYAYTLDDPLAPGSHVITGKIVVQVSLHSASLISSRGPISIPIDFRHEVVVEDRPLSQFVTAHYDELMIKEIRKGCFVSICPVTSTSYELHLCVRHATVWMTGTLEARFAGREKPFVRMDLVQTPIMGNSSKGITFSLPDGVAAEDATIDVCFTPNAKTAFDEDFKAYFAGILEWHDLRIPAPDAPMVATDCQYCEPPFDRSPDVIREWTPTD
ncbi:MAG: hypothetical protein H6819_04315 [Phycisphaerales bacterium]|nr:hypothetical protein [Phycisphaerales bacterium]MCB9856423.1 hypothetical protein [Phycisphaerales bacterium]MCB9864554.1 hypothetical protein [Phycisphaerales bacterium]